MAKFPRKNKVPKQQMQEHVADLCEAVAATRNRSEAAELLTDLLGAQELEMLAVRLKVAELLLDGMSYDEIGKILKTSSGTVARVQNWLRESGEGYRLVLERIKSSRSRKLSVAKDPENLFSLKKRYPMYYWPEIVLEYWMKKSSQKEKQEMRKILNKVSKKTALSKQLNKILNPKLN
jgi:TrpR-related protein YerC/YecD